jgi:hypothetical protein
MSIGSVEGCDGAYTQKEAYFIQNESDSPKLIKRTRKSVEKALAGRVESGDSAGILPPALVDRNEH